MQHAHWLHISNRFLAEMAKHDRLSHLDACVGTVEHLVSATMLKAFRDDEAHTVQQLTALLGDAQARHFVKLVVFTARHVPHALLDPLILAGARTVNPSFNKHFIWPCVLCHGRRPVVSALLQIFRTGSADERSGAAQALYWGSMGRGDIHWPHDHLGRSSRAVDEPVADLISAFEASVLTELLSSRDLHIQRALIAHLPARTPDNADMFDAVVAAARASEDAYMRQRLAYQLGESHLIPCLPSRDAPSAMANPSLRDDPRGHDGGPHHKNTQIIRRQAQISVSLS